MSNNFALAGFPVEDRDGLNDVLRRAFDQGAQEPVREGVVHVDWTGASGAGVDVVVEDGSVVCAKPTFRGEPGVRLSAGRWADATDECAWCLPLWVEVLGETPYPAAVEVDDMAVVRGWLRDEEYDASVTVFADERVEWDNLGERAAIPTGTFGDVPHSRLLVSGEVLAAERRVNELTGVEFVHARVVSLSDAEYDLLLPADEPLPARGEIVRWSGWAVAHVVRPRTKRWWRR